MRLRREGCGCNHARLGYKHVSLSYLSRLQAFSHTVAQSYFLTDMVSYWKVPITERRSPASSGCRFGVLVTIFPFLVDIVDQPIYQDNRP